MTETRQRTDPDGLRTLMAMAFPHARQDVHEMLAELAKLTQAEAGGAVTMQGDIGRLFLVTAGYVGLRRVTRDGRQIMPRIMTTGQLVTILPLGDRASAADGIALTACEVASWWTGDVRALAERDTGFAMDLLEHSIDAFETVIGGVDGLLYQDAVLRVARVLQTHRELLFGDPPTLSRAHLPALVGTSREMTTRVLRKLEATGIVARVGARGLLLRDERALAAAASAR